MPSKYRYNRPPRRPRFSFDDEFLDALGAWQRGWREKAIDRQERAKSLVLAARHLPRRYRRVDGPCYRKRFLAHGDFKAVLLGSGGTEGPSSWTLNREFSESFKGLVRPGTIAAIFCCNPRPEDIIVNVPALWEEPSFVEAAGRYRDKGGAEAQALFNFRAREGEVVLRSKIKGSEIVGLVGVSSHIDDLLDTAGITDEDERERLFKELVASGTYTASAEWVPDKRAQAVVKRTIARARARLRGRH